MQAVTATPAVPAGPRLVASQGTSNSAYQGYQILRRNGAVVVFEPNKIAVALMKAFLAVHGTQGAASASVRETVDSLTETVVRALLRSRPGGGTFHIEDVQDQVELGLMRGGHHEVARAYVLYRERRAQERVRSMPPRPEPEIDRIEAERLRREQIERAEADRLARVPPPSVDTATAALAIAPDRAAVLDDIGHASEHPAVNRLAIKINHSTDSTHDL